MTRALITGASGFLGRHLVDLLLEREHEVVALVHEASHDGANLPAGVIKHGGDVLSPASVLDAARGCEVIFHLAGRVSRDPKDAEGLHRLHVEGTKIALDAAREAGVRRAVVASTSGTVAVSADAKDVRSEAAPPPMELIARWPYYRSKLFAEMAALERNHPPEFEVVVVCPSLLLGPGDERGSSTGDVADFIEGRLPAIPGGGLSFVDARDAAQALLLAWERGRPGERYLVAAQNLTLDAFCQKLERISGVKAPALRLPRSPLLSKLGSLLDEAVAERLSTKPRFDPVSTEMAQYFWYVDSSKARDELGWEARDPNETLVDTVDDLRSRGVVWG